METIHIVILLLTGLGVGFAGGLLGLGGAFLMGPIQYLVYLNMGILPEMAIKIALGTNLMVVLPTALSGTWRHHKKGAVLWKPAIIMGSCSLFGALVGATLATRLPGDFLRIAFGSIVLISGIRMLISRSTQIEGEQVDNPRVWIAWAIPISLIAGLVGIGGGIVAVPVMAMVFRFKMHNAVATSMALMILTSIGGVIGYIVNGMGVSDLPAYSLGYVNLQSWLLLSIPSIIMAQLGALAAHRLPARQLRYIFIVVMFYMGLKMLGVFDWLGLPL